MFKQVILQIFHPSINLEWFKKLYKFFSNVS